MSLASLYDDRIEAGFQRDFKSPKPPEPTSFSTWSMLSAGAKGIPQAGLEVGASVMSGLAISQSESMRAGRPAVLGDQPDDSLRRSEDLKALLQAGPLMRQEANTFAPPETAHTADQVLHGLARIGTKAVLATALPGGSLVAGAALAGEETNTQYQALLAKGIDPNTALKVAGVEGVAAGASIALPMVGPTVKSTIALGLATGPGTYMAQEAVAKKILANAGYHDEALLHNPTDPLGLAISTILPGVVGGVHVAGLRQRASLTRVVEALESGGKRYGKDGELLTSEKGAQGEMQVMPKTALDPGFGVTPARDQSPDELARVGRDYIAAMEKRYPDDPAKALAAYNAGPGAVDAAVKAHGEGWLQQMPSETRGYVAHGLNKFRKDAVDHASQDPDVVNAARVRVTEDALQRNLPDHLEAREEVTASRDEIAAGRMPVVDPLSIEDRFAMKLRDHDAAVKEYATRPDSESGKVLNTDVARELSPDYLADRTRSADVHEPASGFVKRLYAEKLAALPPNGEVMFTSGGTGAGKTTAINSVGDIKAMKDDADIVYDTNMNTLGSARQKIDQALASGAKVRIVHVQRDPVEALVQGALPRAMRQREEFGSGRTVPVVEHARTHRGAAEVIQQLADHYKGNPDVRITVIDNTRGKGQAAKSDLQFVKGFDYNGVEGRLNEALEAQRNAGAISEDVFRGTQGESPVPGARRPVYGVDGSEPQQARDGAGRLPDAGRADAEPLKLEQKEEGPSPLGQRVAALAETSPNQTVRLPGSEETLTVAVALERAKAAAAEESAEAGWVQAALDCALAG